ncbi:sulfur carrier protein ThiS [Corynebacterium uropygiale]|uniref:Sulfur carrier protein ThiS n=1 Tax=Corynebacterium uropygiale TaxID=1775911 RepID=A0A9X1TZT8_9CORY|nr:sulfur carrier protein ThiS [Corynebacterium uropygiale]MCF4007266.1 sulfur carrier protein ThiS [Corynebacterium uropygiale]
MTQVSINGEPYEPAAGESIRDLVEARTGKPVTEGPLGIAVAQDGAVVPRSRWAETPVAGSIEIVTAVQGG